MGNGPIHSDTTSRRYDIGTDLYALSNGVISISPIEVSPSLHTPLHATNNLIDLVTKEFVADSKFFWNINVNIRPLRCIVQCLDYWLQLKRQHPGNVLGNDNVLCQTYTLYLQRDINICPLKPKFAGILTEQFGWSPQHEKFNATLSWKELGNLCAVLKKLDFAENGKHALLRYIATGAMFVGAVALSVF